VAVAVVVAAIVSVDEIPKMNGGKSWSVCARAENEEGAKAISQSN